MLLDVSVALNCPLFTDTPDRLAQFSELEVRYTVGKLAIEILLRAKVMG